MDYLKAHLYRNILVFLGLCLVFSSLLLSELDTLQTILKIVGGCLMLAGVAVSLLYYHCPYCNTMLPLRTFPVPTFCPNCGEKLDSKD